MFANLPFDNAGDKQQLTIALTIVFASGGATITNDLRPIPRTLIAPGRLIQHQSLTTNEYLSAGPPPSAECYIPISNYLVINNEIYLTSYSANRLYRWRPALRAAASS